MIRGSQCEVTLVINTAKREVLNRFINEKLSSIISDNQIFDITGIVDTNIGSIKPRLSVYFSLLRRLKPHNIIITYDGGCSSFSYIKLVLLIIVAALMKKNVKYYSDKGIYGDISDIIPLESPFTPFFLIKNIINIIKAYWICLFSKTKEGEVKGFNKIYAPLSFWYENVGKKQLRFGCWGYCYYDEFGDSQRERFYHHYLSYGYLLNKLGFQRYYALSIMLFITSYLIVFIIAGNWFWGLLLFPVVLISPYFTFSFFSCTKPENIAWFLVLPAFYCAAQGLILPLGILILISSYLSFTVFFMMSTGVIALGLVQLNPQLLFAFIPVSIKLIVDLYPALTGGMIKQIVIVVSGKKGNKISTSHRKYGIKTIPIQHMVMLIFSIFLCIIQFLLNNITFSITITFVILLTVNFLFLRIADTQTFHRYFLTILLCSLLITPDVISYVVILPILFTNYKFVDDIHSYDNNINGQYPPLDRIIWTKIQNKAIDEFIRSVKPGARVLFEYTGHVALSPFRNILSILEAKLADKYIELLPHELTFYSHPDFAYNHSVHLSNQGNIDILNKVLESCNISYVMVFHPELKEKLINNKYVLISEITSDMFNGFLSDKTIPCNHLYLLARGKHDDFYHDSGVTLKQFSNRMVLEGVRPGKEYIIPFTFHRKWKAMQGSVKIPLFPDERYDINFIKFVTKNSSEVKLTFNNIIQFIR